MISTIKKIKNYRTSEASATITHTTYMKFGFHKTQFKHTRPVTILLQQKRPTTTKNNINTNIVFKVKNKDNFCLISNNQKNV